MSKQTARERVKRTPMRSLGERLPAPIRPWYQAARPRSLPATYAALLTGGAVALESGVFEPIRFLLALIGALLLQIASNFVNEYVDFQRGTDALKVAGMGMVLSEGKLSARQVLIGAIVTTVSGALIGLVLVALSGTTLLFIGMFGVAALILYTAGPLPLSHLGLGEVTAFLCFGPLMTFGTYYAVSGQESVTALLAGVPLGFTVAAILHANNMRDIEADRAANKRTLAVRLGLRGALVEYNILIYGAYASLGALIVAGALPITTAIAFLTLWEAVWLVRVTTRSKDAQGLHRAQGRTARLHWWFGLTMTFGWLLAALLKG